MNTMEPQKYLSFVVPSGKYYLGDPCYVILNSEDWISWLNAAYNSNPNEDGVSGGYCAPLPNGLRVLGLNTAHGDGSYRDQFNNLYPVDSGMIGLVPFEYSPKFPDEGRLNKLVEFTEDALCFSLNGILTFGNFVIDTENND
jgi:hypothetical protein